MFLRKTKHPVPAYLAALELLDGCSREELWRIDQLCAGLDVQVGTTLMVEGSAKKEFVVVVHGEVEVSRNGRTLGVLRAGDFVGEMGLLDDVPRTATVTARTSARVLVFSGWEFFDALRIPAVAARINDAAARRRRAGARVVRGVRAANVTAPPLPAPTGNVRFGRLPA